MRWHKKLKVFRCYLFILGWLAALLICLSYWKIDTDGSHSPGPIPRHSAYHGSNNILSDDKPRYKKQRLYCNSPERIKLGHEGEIPSQYELSGVVIIARHGDRGPLMEIKNLTSINCGFKSYGTKMYRKFVADVMNTSKTNTYINFVGPFMKYPILPPPSRCVIGHLSPVGVAQHLHLGRILRSVYIDKHNLLAEPLELDDILAYSSKYRRTFQSLLAFIFSFIPNLDFKNIRLRDSKGLNFCDSYCKCDRTMVLDQQHDQEKSLYMKSHPSVGKLLKQLSSLVKARDFEPDITHPYIMRDALLAYVCHGSRLPCSHEKCVTLDDLAKLLSYEEWETRQKRTPSQIKSAKLKSYGFLKSIFSILDKMMTSSRPKAAIFMGHDKTVTLLLSSLEIPHFQVPYYGARIILELYHNTTAFLLGDDYLKNYYFRLVYNGKDITKLIPFCSVEVVNKLESGNGKLTNMSLCSVISLNNYMKPDSYFREFNATSYSAACIK